MARFKMDLPVDVIADINKIYNNTGRIFGEMTKAGAEVAAANMRTNSPHPDITPHIKVSKVYNTPSDGGINTKAYILGYMPFKNGRMVFSRKGANGQTYHTTKGVPADFVAKVFEYGRSGNPFPKRPFVRKSFNKQQITKAMLQKQKEMSGGLLDE